MGISLDYFREIGDSGRRSKKSHYERIDFLDCESKYRSYPFKNSHERSIKANKTSDD